MNHSQLDKDPMRETGYDSELNKFNQRPMPNSSNDNAFTEDEIQSLRDIFELFDKDKSGRIHVKDLEAIM